jgi:hypothetical protein
MAAVVEDDAPLADVEAEATRLLRRAGEANVLVRLLGGAAVGLHRHGPRPPALDRRYGDIDVVVKKGQDRGLKRLLTELGYVANRSFNNLHGDRRLLFYDERNGRQLDVFIGTFTMCHTMELDDRLQLDPQTLAPADLLLTKLQIVKINNKDVVDGLALILEHEIGDERKGDVIDLDRLTRVTSRDWGWYTTFMDNLGRLAPEPAMGLPPDAAAAVADRVTTIRHAVENSRKSLQWLARSAVGRRVPWYELPEEIGRG